MLLDPALLPAFMLAALALNLTPGPDMLYVLTRGIGQGRQAGVLSALGIGAGTLVHILAAAAGLSALLAASAVAYEVVRWLGAAYLIYLGVQALRSAGNGRLAALPSGTPAQFFRQGFVTNVLNPKVALFFLAFLPQFVDPQRGSVSLQVVLLGLLFNTSGTLVNLGVALLAGRVGTLLRTRPRLAVLQERITGGMFLALGVRLAFGARTGG